MKKIILIISMVLALNANTYAASVADLMNEAIKPIGKCLYVYGGGWNEPDTGAGIEAMTMGISQNWVDFYNANNSSYDYKTTRYQIHNGLDCTGYVGWSMYQLFGDKYSKNGYVYLAEEMAQRYSEIFGGQFIPKGQVTDYKCSDIMSSSGHAYIVIGECSDGSVLFLHASPPNVSLCGTYTPEGNSSSEAIELANNYMNTYFNECYKKYPRCSRNTSYLTDYNQMHWNETVLTDSDGYRNMTPSQILYDMFETVKLYVNDVRIAKNEGVHIKDGTTFAPLRAVSEALGAEVEWFGDEKRIEITKNGTKINLFVNSDKAVVNDVQSVLTNPVFIENDRTFVPVRFITENLGAVVEWKQETKSVKIK